MKKFLFSTMVVAVLAAVIAAAVSAAVTVHAIQPSADEKADSQFDKGHIDQADNACQKGGYDGYINNDCGYLN
jgi:uncharacterized membrane protein